MLRQLAPATELHTLILLNKSLFCDYSTRGWVSPLVRFPFFHPTKTVKALKGPQTTDDTSISTDHWLVSWFLDLPNDCCDADVLCSNRLPDTNIQYQHWTISLHGNIWAPALMVVTRSSISGSACKFFSSLSRLEPKRTAHNATIPWLIILQLLPAIWSSFVYVLFFVGFCNFCVCVYIVFICIF